nr:hypothetical protein [Tanacetum cinerariifolium]
MAPKRARTTRTNPDPTRTTTAIEPMTHEAINNLIAQRVAEALAEYKTQGNSVVNRDTSNTTGTGPRTVRPTRECTYKDYLNCRPLKFNGTEGVIGLTRWFERIESVKFASYTLIGSALTWWNSHMRAVSQEVAYTMPWRTLKQMMTAKYCPRGEIKKLEVELWNLKVKGTDITSYTLHQKLLGIVDRQADNKRKFDNTSRNQQNQQPFRRNNNVAQAYVAGSGEKPYIGTKPLCPKCNFYYDGPCHPKCTNCKRTGHIARDCRSQAANPNYNNNNNRRATVAYQGVPTCFECGAQGHFKNNCPRLGNRNQGNKNQAGNGNAVARAYGLVGMDWLKTYHVVIVYDEKIVRVPFENETLIIRCDGSNNGNQLNIISCTKTRKYLLKGYPVFLANITTKMIKDKSEEKRLQDEPIVRDFSEVFPEDLPGLPPTRQLIVKNRYPFPRIDDLFDQLQGSSIYSKIVQIKQRLQAARDRQKSYADVRRKPLEF